MGRCKRWLDPVDAELHDWGMCICYPRPPLKAWTRADIKHLLGLMDFQLYDLPGEMCYAYDPSRELYMPNPVREGLPASELDQLVIRAACAHSLAGPLTHAALRAELEPRGFELHGRQHAWRGWIWELRHPASDWTFEADSRSLRWLREVAYTHLLHLGWTPVRQPVLADLTTQVTKSTARPERRRAAARPRFAAPLSAQPRQPPRLMSPTPTGVTQLSLDVFAGGAAAPVEPPSTPDG